MRRQQLQGRDATRKHEKVDEDGIREKEEIFVKIYQPLQT